MINSSQDPWCLGPCTALHTQAYSTLGLLNSGLTQLWAYWSLGLLNSGLTHTSQISRRGKKRDSPGGKRGFFQSTDFLTGNFFWPDPYQAISTKNTSAES
jgi:hypothetical protein